MKIDHIVACRSVIYEANCKSLVKNCEEDHEPFKQEP